MSTSSSSSSARPDISRRPIVLCGPSGVGKSTLLKSLFSKYPSTFGFSVSHTTRSPRPGEEDGKAYHFVDRHTFMTLVQEGRFLEWAEFGGNCYGTTAKAVEDVSSLPGRDREGKEAPRRAILDIDTQGVKLIKANHSYLHPLFIFLSPPSMSSLRSRLEKRGTETAESLEKRLAMASSEMQYARDGGHDVVIVNDDVERAGKALEEAVWGMGVSEKLPEEEEE